MFYATLSSPQDWAQSTQVLVQVIKKSAALLDLKACRAGCGWHGWSSSTSPSPASPTRSPIAWMRVSFDDFLSPHQKVYFPPRMQSDCTAICLQTTIGWSDRWQTGWIWIIFNNPWFLLFLRNQNWWCDAIKLALLTRGVKMCIHVMALTWWNYDLSFLQLWQTDRSHAIEAQPGKFLLFGFAFVSSNKQEIKKDCFLFFLTLLTVLASGDRCGHEEADPDHQCLGWAGHKNISSRFSSAEKWENSRGINPINFPRIFSSRCLEIFEFSAPSPLNSFTASDVQQPRSKWYYYHIHRMPYKQSIFSSLTGHCIFGI